MFAVIADRAGAVAIDFGSTIVRTPDYAYVLLVRIFLTAFNGGIKLYKQGAFTFNGKINDQAFFKIASSVFVGTISAFVTYVRDGEVFWVYS